MSKLQRVQARNQHDPILLPSFVYHQIRLIAMSNEKTQTIWIVEFAPLPPHGVGGFDWYYEYQHAAAQFEDHRTNGNLKSHQIGIYSVRLPSDWVWDQIQTWTEDNTNVLPEYPWE